MTDERYNHIITTIMAMDHIVHSFNDEEWIEPWLVYGVPDGLDSRDDYRDAYPNDEELEYEYGNLTAMFCCLIASQTATIKMPESGTDFPSTIRLNGGNIII